MERLFLEFTVRAALLVGGTAIVLYAMRVKAAAAKHTIWLAVMGLMLLLPIWTAWGPKATLRLLPPLSRVTANQQIPLPGALPSALLPSPLISTWQAALLSVYLLGLCSCCCGWLLAQSVHADWLAQLCSRVPYALAPYARHR